MDFQLLVVILVLCVGREDTNNQYQDHNQDQ